MYFPVPQPDLIGMIYFDIYYLTYQHPLLKHFDVDEEIFLHLAKLLYLELMLSIPIDYKRHV